MKNKSSLEDVGVHTMKTKKITKELFYKKVGGKYAL